jgi:signal transduction histidine kinase
MVGMATTLNWCRCAVAAVRSAADSAQPPAVAGAALAVLGLTEAVTLAAVNEVGAQTALALALLALGTTVPLAVLGPTGAALTVCAASVLSLAGFRTLTVAGFVALLIAIYRLGRSGPRHQVPTQLAALLAVPFVVLIFTGPSPGSSEPTALTALLAALAPVASLGGIARHARGEARENRAARQVIADTLIENTARGERARIARELHDVVAHHISMVAVQAEAARLAVPGMPPAGAQRLSAIGDTARTALVEMRRLLGVLHHDTDVDVADRHPQPGLDQLNELVDAARDVSGSAIRLILRGAPIPLDPAVELVAYRVVQEALTNARRYAPGAAVDVELTHAHDTLRVRIRDNGPGPGSPAPAGGHGVTGMRERAVAVGGSVHAGPAASGGYLVDASLPAKLDRPT